jgi:NitT/TauT family transport system permease protein
MKLSTKVLNRVLPLLPLVAWVVVMEGLTRRGIVPAYLIPPPFEVLRALHESRAEILTALGGTLFSASCGLGLSFVLGTAAALVLSASPLLYRAFHPYAVFFQTVPIIAIAPLLVIWFGFGTPTVIASSMICSVFPIIAATLLGLKSTEPALVDLFRLYGASKGDLFLKLRIPHAAPQILAGLRIASGLAVIGAIVGEFIGGGGLGSVVDAARSQQRLDKVFAAVLMSSSLGLVFVLGVEALSRMLLGKWHASERES